MHQVYGAAARLRSPCPALENAENTSPPVSIPANPPVRQVSHMQSRFSPRSRRHGFPDGMTSGEKKAALLTVYNPHRIRGEGLGRQFRSGPAPPRTPKGTPPKAQDFVMCLRRQRQWNLRAVNPLAPTAPSRRHYDTGAVLKVRPHHRLRPQTPGPRSASWCRCPPGRLQFIGRNPRCPSRTQTGAENGRSDRACTAALKRPMPGARPCQRAYAANFTSAWTTPEIGQRTKIVNQILASRPGVSGPV